MPSTPAILLLGCGKMGTALALGWLKGGHPPERLEIVEPAARPADGPLAAIRWRARLEPGAPPDLLAIAVKPQMLRDALAMAPARVGPDTLLLSIAAGASLATLRALAGAPAAVIRAMPNTPAAIGAGVSALVPETRATAAQRALAERLMSAVGPAYWVTSEAELDAVTALSGSGPAYVFHLIECLADAGAAAGLAPELAMALARQTVVGAGALAAARPELAAETLRRDVTSPGGTTQAGLAVLMNGESGLAPLMRATVAAAHARAAELAKQAG